MEKKLKHEAYTTYEAPDIEVIDIKVEQNIMSGSDNGSTIERSDWEEW